MGFFVFDYTSILKRQAYIGVIRVVREVYLLKQIGVTTRNRVYFCFLFGACVLALFMLRIGYMQFIYQKDVLTFAQVQQTAVDLNEPIIEEVKNHFEVNLDGYQEYQLDQLINDGKPSKSVLSLVDLATNACQEGCVGRPAIYLKNKEGFILYQQANGEHVLLTITKPLDRWGIVKKEKH